MIHFNVPPFFGNEFEYMHMAVDNHKICGDGEFTAKCSSWLEEKFSATKVLLTTSGTSALEMAALLCDFSEEDEVILPSYTFSSTANAFVLAGAKLVFVDIRPDTMNIDESKIEDAITDKTRAICVVHYAGVSCEMDKIISIANKYGLIVIEDAAQGITSKYKGKYLGTIGDFGCYSFHETKNFSMGEGGAIVINNDKYIERAEILREKGTNRSKFFRGQIDKYTWVDYGSSYLPSDLNAAYLWGQLQNADQIQEYRMDIWNRYYNSFAYLESSNTIQMPFIPQGCEHNAHMFYLKCKNLRMRSDFIEYMRSKDVLCVFHYIPLHSSPAGTRFGTFSGKDVYTTSESERLVRLPLYYLLSEYDQMYVIEKTKEFFSKYDS